MHPDQDKIVGDVLLNFSKYFDNVTHNLLIAKLVVYGFEKESP